MSRVLAIDPGSTCGYAYSFDGKISPSLAGTWNLSARRHEGAGMRFLRLRKHLEEAMPFEALFYEEVAAHKGTAAAHIYGGIVATIQAFCESREIPYRGIPVGTIKKRATGKGNCGKPEMVTAAMKAFHMPSHCDDNVADAMWLLQIAIEEMPDVD